MSTLDLLGLVCICALFHLCSGQSTNNNCTDGSFGEFAACIYERLENNTSTNSTNTTDTSRRTLDEDARSKVDRCFTDNDCDKPDYDHDPTADLAEPIRDFMNEFRREIGEAPESVVECLKGKFAQAADACLAATGFRYLIANNSSSSSKVPTSAHDPRGQDATCFFFGAGGPPADGNSSEQEQVDFAQVNIASAIRRCVEKKKSEQEKSSKKTLLQKCLFDKVMSDDDGRRAFCQAISACDENGASADCKTQRHQELRAVCSCRREKRNGVLRRLDSLRMAKDGAAAVLAVLQALGDGKKPEQMSRQIRSCFLAHDATPPSTLDLLDMFIVMQQQQQGNDDDHKTGSSEMMGVDRKTLDAIRDLVAVGDYGDNECKPCD